MTAMNIPEEVNTEARRLAIDVCEGLSEVDGCAFVSPRGDNIEGTCEMTRSDIIACAPEGGSPHGRGGRGGPTSDEEFNN